MKRKGISFIILAGIFFVLSLIITHSYLHEGFPYTHDGENHLARFASYKQALREGQFPPRFAPNLYSRYGYPVFNYNYPLANILSLPFSFVHLNYEVTFKILAIAGVWLGIGGVWFWLKELGISGRGRLVGATVYALSPYLVSTLLFRGNIGEILALSLLPWMFWLIEQCKKIDLSLLKGFFLVVLCSAFLLTHNITVIFSLPFLILYGIIRQIGRGDAAKRLVGIAVISVGMTLWFWLPALAEKSFIVVDDANVNTQLFQHFPTLPQLLFSPLQFGFSEKGPIDGLSFSIGIIQLFFFIVGTVVVIKRYSSLFIHKNYLSVVEKHKYKILAVFVFFSWLLIVLQLSFSANIWSLFLPIVKYLQFPWRLGIFWSITVVPIAAFIFEELKAKWKLVFVAILIWQAIGIFRAKPVDYFHHDIQDYDYFTQSTSTNNENRARSFNFTFSGDWQPTAQLESGQGSVDVISWNGSKREYTLHLKSDAVIIEPTMNFPGWQTTVAKKESLNQTEKVPYIDSNTIQGRIAFQLPPGEYVVKTQFTQWTWAREVGNSISLLTIPTALGILLYIKKKGKNA